MGSSLELNTSTNFESESYTFAGFESKGVISNYQSHGQGVQAGEVTFRQRSRSVGIVWEIEMIASRSETMQQGDSLKRHPDTPKWCIKIAQ